MNARTSSRSSSQVTELGVARAVRSRFCRGCLVARATRDEAEGLSFANTKRRFAAINHFHRLSNLSSPAESNPILAARSLEIESHGSRLPRDVIEGNIGAGKSTLMKNLKLCFPPGDPEVAFIDEPVQEWLDKGLLQQLNVFAQAAISDVLERRAFEYSAAADP